MKKSRIIFGVKALVSLTLIAVLYSRIDVASLGAHFRALAAAPLACFFALLFANTLISSAKWRMFLQADGIDLPLRGLFSSYLVATFFNVFLPSNIGGDVYRVYDISRQSSKPVNTVASVFADRLSGFGALTALGLIFPLLGYNLVRNRTVVLAPLVVFLLIALTVWLLLQRAMLMRLLSLTRLAGLKRLESMAHRFLDSVAAYRNRPGLILRVTALSFVFQLAVIVAIYQLSRALGQGIPFAYFCVFVPLVSLMEALPLSIYGIGLRDSGYVFFFTQVGHSREEAAALSLLYVAATLVYSSIGGVVFALRSLGGSKAPPPVGAAECSASEK